MMLRVMLLVFMLAWPWPAAAASFQDDSGQPITVTAPYQRIISLYGAHTENLFSLGAGDQMVGVSTSEDYPPEALRKPALSFRDDPERMLALRPDLVLVRPMIMRGRQGLVDSLRQAGVAVVSLQPMGVDEMFRYWRRLGLLTGHQARAEAMIARFGRELDIIRARVAQVPESQRPRVFFESIHRRMKTFAPDSIAAFALEAAGGVNLAAGAEAVRGTNIASYGKERILSHAMEMDVYLAQEGVMNRVSLADIQREPGFQALKAVRQARVHLIDEQLVSRPTLRLLRGIRLIQAVLYPEMEPDVPDPERSP